MIPGGMVGEGEGGGIVSGRILNSRTPGATAWRLHGYTKSAAGITCMLVRPDGGHINVALMEFAQQAADREWDNDPEDIQAMLELAHMEEVRHE